MTPDDERATLKARDMSAARDMLSRLSPQDALVVIALIELVGKQDQELEFLRRFKIEFGRHD